MGPGLYASIGSKARCLLKNDYVTDQKLTITAYTANGVAITASGTKKKGLITLTSGEIQTQIKNEGFTVDIRLNSDSKLGTTLIAQDITPGLKIYLNFVIPDKKSGKLHLQYLNDNISVNTSIGLTATPVVQIASVFGTKALAIGANVTFDSTSGNFVRYNAGVGYTASDFATSLTMNNKGDSLTASYYHLVKRKSNTAVGAELTYGISNNESTPSSLTFGTQCNLDSRTVMKARINNHGKTSALVKHQWRDKSFITLSGEIDTKSFHKKTCKMGLSLVLKL